MNSRYLEDEDLDSNARELSLSPSTLLGIFFLLAIICAVFFGFGYSMGHRSATASATAAENNETAPLKTSGDTKPSPASQSEDLTPADAAAEASQSEKAESTPPARIAATPAPQAHLERTVATPPTPSQLKPAIVAVKAPVVPATAHPAAPGAPALVQIAAVSHQEDADILVSALKRRGYTVAVRHEPQDKLLHVQLGPFPTRKDADAMKQRLSADGYNAIVK